MFLKDLEIICILIRITGLNGIVFLWGGQKKNAYWERRKTLGKTIKKLNDILK